MTVLPASYYGIAFRDWQPGDRARCSYNGRAASPCSAPVRVQETRTGAVGRGAYVMRRSLCAKHAESTERIHAKIADEAPMPPPRSARDTRREVEGLRRELAALTAALAAAPQSRVPRRTPAKRRPGR